MGKHLFKATTNQFSSKITSCKMKNGEFNFSCKFDFFDCVNKTLRKTKKTIAKFLSEHQNPQDFLSTKSKHENIMFFANRL